MSLSDLRTELKKNADLKQATILCSFFKTKKGEYGEGDIFLGIKVPIQRKIAKNYQNLPLADLIKLLHSKIHEERFTALVLMVNLYQKGDSTLKKQIYDAYFANSKWINNWDLVDTSTPQIVGDYLYNSGDIRALNKLAKSNLLWDRRIAILATFTFIRNNNFKPTLKIAKMLLRDNHDLIHKAVGWMLREVGKKDLKVLKEFLDEHASQMPRTSLRYAIEKLPRGERDGYLAR
jgi:3-methyladenine DNA glycosylase AlkD